MSGVVRVAGCRLMHSAMVWYQYLMVNHHHVIIIIPKLRTIVFTM